MVEKLFSEENKIIPIVLVATILLLFMAIALMLFFRFAKKKIVEKELEKAAIKIGNQKKVLQATIETQERERKRIAQDLHDAISAKLNVVSLHINMLLDDSLSDIEREQALASVLGVTTKVLDSSRQIAHNLLPPILENFGLIAALDELIEEFKETKKIDVEKQIDYHVSLTKNQELHLFRIVQELLNNSIKHGKATQVKIIIDDSENKLHINYLDNGAGFHVKQALKEKGLGLKNIKSRVAILNGELEIRSQQGSGSGSVFKIAIDHTKNNLRIN